MKVAPVSVTKMTGLTWHCYCHGESMVNLKKYEIAECDNGLIIIKYSKELWVHLFLRF